MKMMGQDASKNMGTANGFEFSGTPNNKLGASEYAIANIMMDLSGSVGGWERKLEECQKTIVAACRHCPRSSNLLLRTCSFNDSVKEIHGYVELMKINPADYDNKFNAGGGTALLDATMNAIETVGEYAKELDKKDIFCNAVVFVITDGDENSSQIATIGTQGNRVLRGQKKIAEVLNRVRKEEVLESIKVILIGVADVKTQEGQNLERLLLDFKQNANIDEFLMIGDMSKSTLAKLAGFVTQSFSSSSTALNTGGPSKPINLASVVPIDLDSI